MYITHVGVFLVAQWQRVCLPMQEMWVSSLGWDDPLEKNMDRGAWQATVHGVSNSQI